MARVKVEEIVDHLDREFRRALKDSVTDTMPNANFDERELFRKFKRQIRRRCNTWERVPDRYVEND